jgi:hypothetical protein
MLIYIDVERSTSEDGRVVKASDSSSLGAIRVGSNPTPRTNPIFFEIFVKSQKSPKRGLKGIVIISIVEKDASASARMAEWLRRVN